ncbi:MAG: flagellar export protein FliJ [Treponema sp.]|nr:flagellar export protein FliJ [Treponema sp.]
MKAFHFKLQKLLDLRRYREQETETALGRAMGELAAIDERIKKIAREKIAAAGERFAAGQGVGGIMACDNYILRLDRNKDALLEAAAKQELAVAEAREIYLAASRERKIIDKLKERREAEYRKNSLREETKVLDDIRRVSI